MPEETPDERIGRALLVDTSARRYDILRHIAAALVTMNLFCNHWSRDSVGALEIPLEAEFGFSVMQYNALSAVYFAPNLPVPILAGIISQVFGPANCLVGFALFAFLGNALVMLGATATASAERYGLVLAGRAFMGVAYEAIDVLPIGLMQPRFADKWALLVGIINGVNRLGSVCNFLLEPLLFASGGLVLALLVPSLLGASMLVSALVMHRVDSKLRGIERQRESQTSSSSSSSSGSSSSRSGSSSSSSGGGGGGRDSEHSAVVKPAPLTLRSLCAFSRTYWLYLLGSACAYGCVVPFWFIGSKAIAVRWKMSLAAADMYLLWPEGAIGVIAPPFGMLIDRRRWNLRTRLVVSAVSLALIPCAHLALAWLPLPPVIGVGLLGIGYAFVQNLIWSAIALASPPALLNLSAGLIGCAVNVLPAVLPAFVFTGHSEADLVALAATGFVGVAAFALAAYQLSTEAVRL